MEVIVQKTLDNRYCVYVIINETTKSFISYFDEKSSALEIASNIRDMLNLVIESKE